jgi:hypothetical protein
LGKSSLAESEKSNRDAKRLKGGVFHILDWRLLSNYLTMNQQKSDFRVAKQGKREIRNRL